MRSVCASVLVLLGSLAGPAAAQPADSPASAEELVAQGEQLARAGRVAESLPFFLEAAELESSGKHECLVALTYFRLQRYPEAWIHIERAKAHGERPRWCGDAVLVRDVERALESGGFAPVEIDSAPSGARLTVSSLAPEERLVAPVRLWLPWGTQRVRVELPGYERRDLDVVVEGKESIEVSAVLQPSRVDAKAQARGIALPATRDQVHGETGSQRRWPWGLVVVGAASLAAGAGFHVAAASSRDAAAGTYDGPAYEAEIDRFHFRRAAAIGLYAAGAVLTATGVVLLARSKNERPSRDAVVSLVPTEGGAAIWLRVER